MLRAIRPPTASSETIKSPSRRPSNLSRAPAVEVPLGRWPRPVPIRLEEGEHGHDPREEPEGLHAPHDDEGVGADGMGEQAHRAGHEAQREAALQRIPEGAERVEAAPEDRPDQPEERRQPDQAGLDQGPRKLRIHEPETRHPPAEDRALGPADPNSTRLNS